jgi:hypothetical protein
MAILATQKVLTLDYWQVANDLRPGDYVFDRNGKIVQIKLAQVYRADNCYEVMFSDHLTLQGDDKLRLPLEDRHYRIKSDRYKARLAFRRPLKMLSVADLLEAPLKDKRSRLKYSVPTTKPLQLPHQTLPVPPFVFGFWFFNQLTSGNFVPLAGTSEFIQQKFKDAGYKIRKRKIAFNKEREFNTTPTVISHLIPNVPTKIPNNYLLAAPDQRFELLQGILYSKPRQYNKKYNRFRFSSKFLPIATQVQYLAESLGCKTTLFYDENRNSYTVFIRTKLQFYPDKQSPSTAVHQARRLVTNITQIEPQACVHIETTGEDNTILVGEGFISCL